MRSEGRSVAPHRNDSAESRAKQFRDSSFGVRRFHVRAVPYWRTVAEKENGAEFGFHPVPAPTVPRLCGTMEQKA